MTRSASDGQAAACAAIRKVVYEFIDAELPTSESTRVESHLSACPPCAGYVAFERAFLAVVQRRTTVEQAPPELRDRLREALAREKDQRRRT
jgi:mycothiol system anti-sigma-R factor